MFINAQRLGRIALIVVTTLVCSVWVRQVRAEIVSVGGYLTDNDSFQHAIVTTNDGKLYEIFFDPTRGIFRSDLGCYGSVVTSSSFYTPDDNVQHVLLAMADGNLREVFFNSSIGVHYSAPLINLPGTIALAAFYAADDKNRIVLAATADGTIREVFYNSATGVHGGEPIGNVGNAVAIAGFYTPDDKMRHALVVRQQGDIVEIFYSSSAGVHVTPPLANIPGAISVTGVYTPDDRQRHAIVATKTGEIFEIFYGGAVTPHVSRPALAALPGIVSVASYYTPKDGNRHVIAGTASGEIREIFFNPKTGVGNDQLAQILPETLAGEDISPDAQNGIQVVAPSRSGLIERLTGDNSALYGVALNGGVWKAVSGGAWRRLSGSPRYAYSIAVDPKNASHLAVGERGGDGVDPHKDSAGLWESLNAGESWQYVLDPLNQSGCNSQAVPAVAFSASSTLFVATTCGVARRAANASTFAIVTSTSNVGAITNVVTSDTKVWARSARQLLVSADDGVSWTVKPIPASVSFTRPGDEFALGAFDSAAYMTCCESPIPPCGTLNRLLVYDLKSNQFILQKDLFANGNSQKPQLGCDGTGLGGSRFIKTYISPGIEGAPAFRLFYGSAQEIYEATGINSDSLIDQWSRPLGATCGGCTNQDKVHSDIWDFHISPNGTTEWVAGDGGVYRRSLINNTFWTPWTQQDAGLHTQHIHTITAMRSGPTGRANLAYATSDNDAWYWDTANGWASGGALGDANWTAGDAGNPGVALLVRIPSVADLTGFGAALPSGVAFQGITINNDGSRDGPEFFNFIQSLSTESPARLSLDAVMLANLPLQFRDANKTLQNVPGVLGSTPPVGTENPVLVRNSNFVALPDINISKGQGWQIAANNLPAGTAGFWVSGGHGNPVYFVYAVQSGNAHLYKQNGVTAQGLTIWLELNVQGNTSAPKPWPVSGILTGGTYGPAFVNPYNPNHIYVLTSSGVRVSTDGGASFQPDTDLTNLITSNGEFPLLGAFPGGAGSAVRIASRAVAFGTLADMAFCRDNPNFVVAGSPFTGVFFRNETGKWRDLTGQLPKPFSPVSSVQIDCDSIYVATEGGGVTRITGFGR